jgi:hypothetical protein
VGPSACDNTEGSGEVEVRPDTIVLFCLEGRARAVGEVAMASSQAHYTTINPNAGEDGMMMGEKEEDGPSDPETTSHPSLSTSSVTNLHTPPPPAARRRRCHEVSAAYAGCMDYRLPPCPVLDVLHDHFSFPVVVDGTLAVVAVAAAVSLLATLGPVLRDATTSRRDEATRGRRSE